MTNLPLKITITIAVVVAGFLSFLILGISMIIASAVAKYGLLITWLLISMLAGLNIWYESTND